MAAFFKYFAITLLVILIVFLLGPAPDVKINDYHIKKTPQISAEQLEKQVADKESAINNLKEGNEAEIIWANDSLKNKTEYVLVYLHGFSASKEEGKPVYDAFLKRYHCNAYLARFAEHGIQSEDAMLNINAENYWNSAKEALEIGKQLGDKVILMGTSTGGTLGLLLAAYNPDDVDALIFYSPNIDMADPTSFAISGPWGLQIARLAFGGKYREFEATDEVKKYWQNRYRLEALVFLKRFLKEHMTEETFSKVKQPLFLGYYYKDEQNQDQIVSVASSREMFQQIATPENLKWDVPFPEAKSHVITSNFYSKDLENVIQKTFEFTEQVIGIKPFEKDSI